MVPASASFSIDPALAADLFISEYIEGSSFNKAIEIYNGTGSPVDLSTGGYSLQVYYNGAATAGLTIPLSGTVENGDVYVVAAKSAAAAIHAQADLISTSDSWFNGDDAVVLRRSTEVTDVIGQVGFDPGTEWGSGLTSTADNTIRRKTTICAGDPIPNDAFDPSTEWDGYPQDTFDGLGSHTATCGGSNLPPSVVSTTPSNGVTSVALDESVEITFSESVTPSGDWFAIDCTVSGARTAGVTGGPTSWSLDPDGNFTAGENCTVTILASWIADDAGQSMSNDYEWTFGVVGGAVCSSAFTPAYTIQGSGATTPLGGQTVTTRGVVVGDFEGSAPTLRGFYLQDLSGDGDPTTSDAVFVFNGSDDSVELGDVVIVTGTVSEFQGQTQVSASGVVTCGSGSVEPIDVLLPFPSAAYLERYEGMLVRLPQTLTVTEHFQLGRYGQVVLSSGGRLVQPTSVVAPGAAAAAMQAQNILNRLILDDAANNQNPDPILLGGSGMPLTASNPLRGGDRVAGIVGVLTYTWAGSGSSNAYRVRPVNSLNGGVPDFVSDNPRPTAPAIGGSMRIAAFNVLNYFNTFVSGCGNPAGGTATDCRGADDATEFSRQWPKTVDAIVGMNADVVGLIEIENDGYGPSSAIAHLVGRLNAATAANTYAFVDVDDRTGQMNALGDDAIKVGLIYRADRVSPVGETAVLNSVAFVNAGDNEPRNRPALAQAFEQGDGGRAIAVVNHLKSKGTACNDGDQGDGQGNCNNVRTRAADELVRWLEADPTGTADPDILILGDLNAYAREDPISRILSAGYTNLLLDRLGTGAYSYVFDGQWGYLDHALASSALAPRVAGLASWHINADEPSVLDYNTNFKSASQIASLYAPDRHRSSDHDPLIVGLNLPTPYPFSGFLPPVAPLPAFNSVRAGSAVPIKFSLGGDRGTGILAPGYPKSVAISCQPSAAVADTRETSSAGASSLSYDPITDTYTYLWKTDRSWSDSCRRLLLRLDDGTEYRADFRFRR